MEVVKTQTSKSESLKFLLSLNLNEDIKTLYAISNNIENNYHVFKIKKRNGNYRTIYAPKPKLKKIQRLILKNILEKMPISSYAKAYHKNIS